MSSQNSNYIDQRYPLSALTGRIIAAAQAVHRELGPGFEEIVYQRALALEMGADGLEYEREVSIEVQYRGQRVGNKRVDFVVGNESGSVMLEIKAKAKLEDIDYIQILSYLKASGFKVGLLINFGGRSVVIKRFVN